MEVTMTIEILKSMAKDGQVFSFNQLYQKTLIKKEVLRVMLARMEERGVVERIEKGKYMIIPLGSEKGKYTLHEFVIGTYLVEPSAISYWSALHYYGMTEQIPSTVFVQTPTRKKKSLIKIFGVNYRIVRVKREKLFGLRKDWIEEMPVNITDKEKTIIDCLDKPQFSGGIIEVAKALMSGSLNPQRLSEYALKIGNYAVVRRLGYLSERIGLKLNLPPPKSRKYLQLDPKMPPIGFNDPKWRLVINLDTMLLGDLE
jgi:predicted transcriptional regulator of viral defense system